MTELGLLVMAYGGPDSLEDVEPYLLDVRGFRETPRAMIEQTRERYDRIGGRSRILERSRSQADALQRALRKSGNDPDADQLAVTVGALIALLGERPHRFAYQSAAMTPDPWLAPDVADVVDELARESVRDVLVAPIGFVCEHVEILYDIDLELQDHAVRLGIRLERIEMLNDHPEMIAGLARLVRERAAEAGWVSRCASTS